MKALYLAGSIIFSALVLILSFGNINAQCSNMHFLFYQINANPTFIVLGVAAIGILTGALYHAFIVKVLETDDDDEDEDF